MKINWQTRSALLWLPLSPSLSAGCGTVGLEALDAMVGWDLDTMAGGGLLQALGLALALALGLGLGLVANAGAGSAASTLAAAATFGADGRSPRLVASRTTGFLAGGLQPADKSILFWLVLKGGKWKNWQFKFCLVQVSERGLRSKERNPLSTLLLSHLLELVGDEACQRVHRFFNQLGARG